MKKKILFLILLLVFGVIFIFWNDLTAFYSRASLKLPQIEKGLIGLATEKAGESINLPEPLRSDKEVREGLLTRAGVIKWTNVQREKYGLPLLKENKILDAMADKKVQDMFEKQYFAHKSPSGVGVDNLAEKFGYKFIAIGENLALGNFENDEILVQDWMNSPGHRANILNSRYQEIGIGVAKAVFEGKTAWLAVQHFGLPLAACPTTNEALKSEIESNQAQINLLQESLNRLENEIKTMRPKGGAEYNQKIEEYNNLVLKYDALVGQTKQIINQYNNQVELFNKCASGAD